MPDEAEKSYRAAVNTEEIRAAFEVPAPGANKFIVNVGQPGVRIAFGETHNDLELPVFRSAVTLHPIDAISLYKVLEEMMKDIEKQIVPMSPEAEDG